MQVRARPRCAQHSRCVRALPGARARFAGRPEYTLHDRTIRPWMRHESHESQLESQCLRIHHRSGGDGCSWRGNSAGTHSDYASKSVRDTVPLTATLSPTTCMQKKHTLAARSVMAVAASAALLSDSSPAVDGSPYPATPPVRPTFCQAMIVSPSSPYVCRRVADRSLVCLGRCHEKTSHLAIHTMTGGDMQFTVVPVYMLSLEATGGVSAPLYLQNKTVSGHPP